MRVKNNSIYRIMLCTIAGMIGLICVFYFSQTIQLRNQSIAALKSFTQNGSGKERPSGPGIDYFSEEDIHDDMGTETERLIWEYYEENETAVSEGEIYEISRGMLKAYFLVKTGGLAGVYTFNNEDEVLILYADVSFTMNIIRNSVMVMIVALIILIVVLYFANHYLVRRLNEKDMAMRSFFENASHELKTPLMAIGGYIEGMKTGITDEETSYEVIDKEISRMSKLISDILNISKVDGGAVKVQKSETDVREIIYDCLSAIVPAVQEKGIELYVNLEKPMITICDENMVASIFANILSNAVRYADSHISVTAEDTKIIIANDGRLPSEEDMAHIFERFYKGKNGHTGIGMALAWEYARLNHMELSAGIEEKQVQFIVRY